MGFSTTVFIRRVEFLKHGFCGISNKGLTPLELVIINVERAEFIAAEIHMHGLDG